MEFFFAFYFGQNDDSDDDDDSGNVDGIDNNNFNHNKLAKDLFVRDSKRLVCLGQLGVIHVEQPWLEITLSDHNLILKMSGQ